MGAPKGNKYAVGNQGGRPTKYNETVLEIAWDYINGGFEARSVIPTVEEFALLVGVSKKTLYEWEKEEDKKEFCYAMDSLRNLQASLTINKGLTGEWLNNIIIGRLLTTHGYKEKIETDNKNKNETTVGASQELLDRISQLKRNIMACADKTGTE
ncbi:MAG: hypothetical protein HN929_11455 [Chloroflexi bacterium]|jgi:DNA-binding XRE family transcriptional regulator|nr:hypothetical protein [Chloroflexota bacterium]